MKILNNKRGVVGILPIIIAIMFCAIVALVVINQLNAYDTIVSIGRVPKAMDEAYVKAEMARNYIGYAGKYAGYQAIYDIGINGGFNKELIEPKCGSTGDYIIWKSRENDCRPSEEDLKNSFNYTFEDIFDQMLSNFILNYDLAYGTVSTIYGSTDITTKIEFGSDINVKGSPLIYSVVYSEEDDSGEEVDLFEELEPSSLIISDAFNGFEYGIEPYFASTISIDLLSTYSEVSKLLNDNLGDFKSCNGEEQCITNKAKKLSDETNYEWSVKVETGNLLFDVKSKNNNILALTDKKLESIGVPIRFAIM